MVPELYINKVDINFKEEDFNLKMLTDLNVINEEIKNIFLSFEDFYFLQVEYNINEYILRKKYV